MTDDIRTSAKILEQAMDLEQEGRKFYQQAA
jgi:rubrerythrin